MQPSGAPNTVYVIIPVTTNLLEFYIEALLYPTRSLNNNPLTGQILTLGKRLSARTYIGYEHGVGESRQSGGEGKEGGGERILQREFHKEQNRTIGQPSAAWRPA